MQAFTGATVLRRITIPVRLHAALTMRIGKVGSATLVVAAAIVSAYLQVLRAVHARSLAAPINVAVTLKVAAAVFCSIFLTDSCCTPTPFRKATGFWHAGGALACYGGPVTVVHAVVAAFGDVVAFNPQPLATTVLLRYSVDPYVPASKAVHTIIILLWTTRGRDAEQGAIAARVFIVVWGAGFPYHGLTCG